MKLKRLLTVVVILIAIYSSFGIWLRSIYVVPVLMYHNIDGNSDNSGLSVSPESFEKQMKFLHDNNYSVMSLEELIGIIRSNSNIPKKVVCITIDDGHQNNYSNAYPVLKKYNFPANFFIITSLIGKEEYMTWDELREVQENKIFIGSHSKSHPFLTSIKDKDKLMDEIAGSKAILESNIKDKVSFFCYPIGNFDDTVRQAVIDAGYWGAVGTNPPLKYSRKDFYAIPRIKISRNCDNPIIFWFETSGYYTFIKDFKKKFKNFRKGLDDEGNQRN